MVDHPYSDDRHLAQLVRALRAGDEIAWTRLVTRLDHGLRNIARSYRLTPTDIDDVMQATWLRVFRNIEQLHEATAIVGWLATTTRARVPAPPASARPRIADRRPAPR
jgi:DNA-directed RNA polymerase specialized sigma24 family protein